MQQKSTMSLVTALQNASKPLNSKLSLIDNFLYRCFLYTFNLHPNERYTLLSLCSLPGGTMVKNLPANAVNTDFIPGSRRSPGEGNGNPLLYSCPENSMDRGAWWAIVHEVAKNLTQLSTHKHTRATYSFKN